VNAVILIAGVARRLAPLTDTTHKALLPVGGRPILAVVALVCIAWGWSLFDQAPDKGEVHEPAASAAAH